MPRSLTCDLKNVPGFGVSACVDLLAQAAARARQWGTRLVVIARAPLSATPRSNIVVRARERVFSTVCTAAARQGASAVVVLGADSVATEAAVAVATAAIASEVSEFDTRHVVSWTRCADVRVESCRGAPVWCSTFMRCGLCVGGVDWRSLCVRVYAAEAGLGIHPFGCAGGTSHPRARCCFLCCLCWICMSATIVRVSIGAHGDKLTH